MTLFATHECGADVRVLRERARQEIEKGPLTPAYGAEVDRVITVLSEAPATEIVCVLRCRQHYYDAKGINAEPVAAEFLEHAREEREHADRLAERITQSGGSPDLNPDTLTGRAHSEYRTATDLIEMINFPEKMA